MEGMTAPLMCPTGKRSQAGSTSNTECR
jgi:hypothetical protein